MRLVSPHVMSQVMGQIFVNGNPVEYVEGMMRRGEVTLLWTELDGARWEGKVTAMRVVIPKEGEVGVQELRFQVKEPRLVRRSTSGRKRNGKETG